MLHFLHFLPFYGSQATTDAQLTTGNHGHLLPFYASIPCLLMLQVTVAVLDTFYFHPRLTRFTSTFFAWGGRGMSYTVADFLFYRKATRVQSGFSRFKDRTPAEVELRKLIFLSRHIRELAFHILRNQLQLLQRSLEVFDNVPQDYSRLGKVGRVLQAFILRQKMSRLALSRAMI